MSHVTAMEEKRKKMRKSVDWFYAVPRDPPSESALPIFDENHVRNAMARFNQVDFESLTEKKKAFGKILKVARKYKIEIDEFLDLKV